MNMNHLKVNHLKGFISPQSGFNSNQKNLTRPVFANQMKTTLTPGSDQVHFRHQAQDQAVLFGNSSSSTDKAVLDNTALMFPDAAKLVEAYWQKALLCQTPQAMSVLI